MSEIKIPQTPGSYSSQLPIAKQQHAQIGTISKPTNQQLAKNPKALQVLEQSKPHHKIHENPIFGDFLRRMGLSPEENPKNFAEYQAKLEKIAQEEQKSPSSLVSELDQLTAKSAQSITIELKHPEFYSEEKFAHGGDYLLYKLQHTPQYKYPELQRYFEGKYFTQLADPQVESNYPSHYRGKGISQNQKHFQEQLANAASISLTLQGIQMSESLQEIKSHHEAATKHFVEFGNRWGQADYELEKIQGLSKAFFKKANAKFQAQSQKREFQKEAAIKEQQKYENQNALYGAPLQADGVRNYSSELKYHTLSQVMAVDEAKLSSRSALYAREFAGASGEKLRQSVGEIIYPDLPGRLCPEIKFSDPRVQKLLSMSSNYSKSNNVDKYNTMYKLQEFKTEQAQERYPSFSAYFKIDDLSAYEAKILNCLKDIHEAKNDQAATIARRRLMTLSKGAKGLAYVWFVGVGTGPTLLDMTGGGRKLRATLRNLKQPLQTREIDLGHPMHQLPKK